MPYLLKKPGFRMNSFRKAQWDRTKINVTTIEIDQNDAKKYLSLFFYRSFWSGSS